MLSWAKDLVSSPSKVQAALGFSEAEAPKETAALDSSRKDDNHKLKFFVGIEPMSRFRIWVFILRMVRSVLESTSRIFFKFVYKGHKEPLPAIKDLILLESASSLAFKIRTKKLKSEQVVEAFIERIKEVNDILNCVVDHRFEEALAEAKQIDSFLQSESFDEKQLAAEKPFLGLPFTIKDSFGMKGLKFTSGSYLRRKNVAQEDAEVVSLMKRAGAIPLGVTNVPEMCLWWESYNLIYGRTRNPHDVSRSCGGSSGGEAAVQAAGGCPIGIGSDIGGSIRMPAFFCGIFGHKPSTGIVSIEGQIPVVPGEAANFISVGPMSRFACDLLPALRVLADKNVSKLQLDSKVDIKKLRYFYMDDDIQFPLVTPISDELKDTVTSVVKHFETAYKIKVQKIHLEKMKNATEMWAFKVLESADLVICDMLTQKQHSINVKWEWMKFLVGCSNYTLPALFLTLHDSFKGHKGFVEQHSRVLDMLAEFRREVYEILGDDGVLLYPTHPTTAPYHNQAFLRPLNFAYTAIFNVLGVPVTQCPIGLSNEGIPLGIQVIAGVNNDHLTLAVGSELERAFGGWIPPSKIP